MARFLVCLPLLSVAVAEEGHSHDGAFEWAGTFNVADYEYVTWTAQQKEEGGYPDDTMKIAVMRGNADFSLEGAAPASSESVELLGGHAMENTCTNLTNGATIPISAEDSPNVGDEPACYRLVFSTQVHTTIFSIDTTGIDSIAIFAEHFPIEFERDAHYLKGPDGSDIEPIDEHPVPEEPEKRWGAAIAAAAVVMICTFTGVIFLVPVFTRLQKEHEAVVTILTSAFAAGALLAAAFYLMLYEATHLIAITEERPESAAAAWWGSATLIGFITPFLLESLVTSIVGTAEKEAPAEADAEKNKAEQEVRVNVEPSRKVRVLSGVLLGDFFHNLVDGFFIGAAFSHCETSMGWTITLATVYHELAQELSDYLVLTNPMQGGLKPVKALGLNFLSGTSVILGVVIVLAAEPSNFINGLLLACGAGVYLQIAATECMPRVHELATTLQRRLGGVLLFFLGAIAIGLVLVKHEHCAGEGDAHAHP